MDIIQQIALILFVISVIVCVIAMSKEMEKVKDEAHKATLKAINVMTENSMLKIEICQLKKKMNNDIAT